MKDWIARGEPVETGAPALAPPASRRVVRRRPLRELRARATAPHSVAGLLALWGTIVAGAGALYWAAAALGLPSLREGGTPVPATAGGFATAIYFSFVTALSVGFGDVVPVGAMRAVAVAESAAALLLFGALISKLVSQRQAKLVEEIHRLSFESRLGRVRTSLHQVLAELQSISAGAAAALSAERAALRLESVSLVLAGELRVVHDVLYRPQLVPDEPVLDALLENLAAVLQELGVALAAAGSAAAAPAVAPVLRSIRGLAEEICGDCVPHEYAPALRESMDRVRSLARALA